MLRKGQGFKIADLRDRDPDVFTLGLAWEMTAGRNVDLDAGAICLNAKLQVVLRTRAIT